MRHKYFGYLKPKKSYLKLIIFVFVVLILQGILVNAYLQYIAKQVNEARAEGSESVKTLPTSDDNVFCDLDVVLCENEQEVWVTKYTLEETSHNNGIMASGKYVYEGAVAVSDRNIPFGTKLTIDGKEYTVEDRTAMWVHERQGLTIDIYSIDYNEALAFGKQRKEISWN